MRTRTVAGVLVVVLLHAGCFGGDDDAADAQERFASSAEWINRDSLHPSPDGSLPAVRTSPVDITEPGEYTLRAGPAPIEVMESHADDFRDGFVSYGIGTPLDTDEYLVLGQFDGPPRVVDATDTKFYVEVTMNVLDVTGAYPDFSLWLV